MKTDEEALLQFCTAQRELVALDDATVLRRRQLTRSTTVLREALREQMVSANATCVPLQFGEKQRYAILYQPKPNVVVTCEHVMAALRSMTYDAVHAYKGTLEAAIEGAIEQTLLKADPTSNAGKLRLKILDKQPSDAPLKPVHPASLSRIQEAADCLHGSSEASKALRKKHEARRKELQSTTKAVEENVAKHLVQHDPEHATRRVRLVHNNSEATFYLRRKEATRTTKPTLRTALPAIRRVVGSLRTREGIEEGPTWNSFRWLTNPLTLAKVEKAVEECLKAMHATKKNSRVVMTPVLTPA